MFGVMKNSNIANNFPISIQFLKCSKQWGSWVSVTFYRESVTVFVEYQLPVFVENPTALIPSSDPVIQVTACSLDKSSKADKEGISG